MKTYKTQEEVEKDIVNGILMIEDDVTFECDIKISANIKARNINARHIKAQNINAWNIDAFDINARDINAGNINARDIDAGNITYYAFAIAYLSFKCSSITGRRENSLHKCLDGEIEIKAYQ